MWRLTVSITGLCPLSYCKTFTLGPFFKCSSCIVVVYRLVSIYSLYNEKPLPCNSVITCAILYKGTNDPHYLGYFRRFIMLLEGVNKHIV